MKKKHMLLESMLPNKNEATYSGGRKPYHDPTSQLTGTGKPNVTGPIPTDDFENETDLQPGDRVKVVYGNEFYGMTGTIEDVKNGFVIVSVDEDGGEYSMHSSDVEKIGEEDDDDNWDTTDRDDVHPAGWPGMTEARDINDPALVASRSRNDDFQNGDKVKITSKLNRYRGATGEIHDLHDDGTAMVILDDPKRTTITVNLGQIEKLTDDSWDTMDRDDVHPAGWPGMTEVKNFDIVNYLKENRMFKKNTL